MGRQSHRQHIETQTTAWSWTDCKPCLVRLCQVNGIATEGFPYSYTRNPLYCNWVFVLLPTLAVLFNTQWVFVADLLFFLYLDQVIIPNEEAFLMRESVFGNGPVLFKLLAARTLRLILCVCLPAPRSLWRRICGILGNYTSMASKTVVTIKKINLKLKRCIRSAPNLRRIETAQRSLSALGTPSRNCKQYHSEYRSRVQI